jgi:hypothetical protein
VTPVIRTYTGREINPLALRTEDIDILDIAHALSHVPRFAGHTKKPIFVAQHCIYVAKLCQHRGEPRVIQLKALLHDAMEAYLGDMTKWVKQSPEMAHFRACEDAGQAVINNAFNAPQGSHPSIEWADRVMVRFEGRHALGFGASFHIDHPNYPPLTEEECDAVGPWYPWNSQRCKNRFLDMFADFADLVIVAGALNVST